MKNIPTFDNFLYEGATEFPSAYSIDDKVDFVPSAKQADDRKITRDYRFGTIVKVSFSKAKVFYDILDDYYGEIFTNVDSSFVKPIKQLKLEE
jgi:hypothetical protein